ncbi:MAG: hypothetical protein QOG54_2685 [Actinomycetota bacterium]|jgi:uncharacterized protein (TIGR02421 family)|nr:hypothetical protein [Actinomycetota bacterium]
MTSPVDLEIGDVGRRLDLLLNLTPVNAADAWIEFEASGFTRVPEFHYRPLGFDPASLRDKLRALPIEDATEPAFGQLLSAKARELETQIDLLEARDTDAFIDVSIRLYGGVSDPLLESAQKILANLPSHEKDGERVDADQMRIRAQQELDAYRATYPSFDRTVEVRSDVVDLMVSHGTLMIGERSRFRRTRVEALIQHEVGTHVVTFFNGAQQPLSLMCLGLDGYEETQEGLAVMAEYATGGLDPLRMRIIAARVVAVKKAIDGAGFLDIFEELRQDHALSPRSAWSITARVARSGGLTKDAMYLRGLEEILDHCGNGRDIEPLLAGKIALIHVPLVADLIERGALNKPAIRPAWLGGEGDTRLRALSPNTNVIDLLEGP